MLGNAALVSCSRIELNQSDEFIESIIRYIIWFSVSRNVYDLIIRIQKNRFYPKRTESRKVDVVITTSHNAQ